MIEQLTTIDEKIARLKKRREKVQTQQAIFFMREVQKIFQNSFSPEMVLSILSEIWSTASENQKQNWKKRRHSFRSSSTQKPQQKPAVLEPISQQS